MQGNSPKNIGCSKYFKRLQCFLLLADQDVFKEPPKRFNMLESNPDLIVCQLKHTQSVVVVVCVCVCVRERERERERWQQGPIDIQVCADLTNSPYLVPDPRVAHQIFRTQVNINIHYVCFTRVTNPVHITEREREIDHVTCHIRHIIMYSIDRLGNYRATTANNLYTHCWLMEYLETVPLHHHHHHHHHQQTSDHNSFIIMTITNSCHCQVFISK